MFMIVFWEADTKLSEAPEAKLIQVPCVSITIQWLWGENAKDRDSEHTVKEDKCYIKSLPETNAFVHTVILKG